MAKWVSLNLVTLWKEESFAITPNSVRQSVRRLSGFDNKPFKKTRDDADWARLIKEKSKIHHSQAKFINLDFEQHDKAAKCECKTQFP